MVDTTSKDIGGLLGRNAKQVANIEDEGFKAKLGATLVRPQDNIRVSNDLTQKLKQEIGTAFIFGHPVNGAVGTTFTLGTGDLGASSEISRTLLNNAYRHTFLNTTFIDVANTTASLVTGSCIFAAGGTQEFCRTIQLFKEPGGTMSQVRISTVADNNDNVLRQADTGSGFVTIPQDVLTAVTSGSILDVRIANAPDGPNFKAAIISQIKVNFIN